MFFQNHRSIFLKYRHSFSLRDLVIDEIKLGLQSSTCTKEERKTLTDYLTEMLDLGIEVGTKPPIYLKNSIRNSIANDERRNWRVFANGRRDYRYNQTRANIQKNDPYVTESDVMRKIDSFCDSWKKDIKSKSNQYRAPKFTKKDYNSNNKETAFDNEDSISQLSLKIYQETNQIIGGKTRDCGNRNIRTPKTEYNWRAGKKSNESSKTEGSWRAKKPNDGDCSSKSSKTIDQQYSANNTRSNNDFEQLMADYRKMKISQSAKDNRTTDGNLMESKRDSKNRAKSGSHYGKTSGDSHRRAEMRSAKRAPKCDEGSESDEDIETAFKQLDKPFKPGNIRF